MPSRSKAMSGEAQQSQVSPSLTNPTVMSLIARGVEEIVGIEWLLVRNMYLYFNME